MKNILFFDTDHILGTFSETHPIKGQNLLFFEESVNSVSAKKAEPFADTEIISLFTHSNVVKNAKLDLFPNLKLIATRSTGFNHLDLDYCKRRGIVVSNVPRYGETTVAEYAMGLLLALSRKIIQGRNGMAHNHIEISKYMGFDLFGKKIGIIGTGSIGRYMIKLAQGFGMHVMAYDPYHTPELKGLYVKDIKKIYQECDVISLHIPSTPENYHLINKEAFESMKKGVIIINTARGDLVDTQALYRALRQGIVGGAGLDVLENEDFLLHDEAMSGSAEDNPEVLLDSAMNLKLLQFRNVIATPHIAFNSMDAINRINEVSFDNIENFLKGKPQNNVVK